MAHSIPESNALILRTPHGNVLHTGDWKIDPTPVIGQPTDEAKLRKAGADGILAVIGDSTNAVRDGRSPSEADVARTIGELVKNAPARVAVTTFASNVARIRAVADAARAAGREVVVVGRAMERVIQVARETGYLDGVQDFRSVDAYGYLPHDKVVALCTGSQGEPRAALARIAKDDHPEVTLVRGDRVIFSSRTIPGNEKAVGRVVNGLIAQQRGGHHRSDPSRPCLRPSARRRDGGDARLAQDRRCLCRCMARNCICTNTPQSAAGSAFRTSCAAATAIWCALARATPGIVDELPSGRLYKDGAVLISAEGTTISERRKLSFAGIVTVALAVTEKGVLAADPEVSLAGIPGTGPGWDDLAEVAYDAVMDTFESLAEATPARSGRDRGIGPPRACALQSPRIGARSRYALSRADGMSVRKQSSMIGRLNHVAIAVRDIAKAAKVYRETLGAEVSAAVPQPDHGVTTVFITLPNTKIELLEPLGADSPIAKFLERNPDGGIHHVCYEVDDILAARDRLKGQGRADTR